MTAGNHRFSKNIKDYELLKLIGKGSFGRVYEARTPDGQRVAIKIISKKLSKAKKIEERNEGLLHSQLNHPSILKLYVNFSDDHADYFVMELCEKGDLRRYMKNCGFDEQQVRKMFRQLAEGLHYMHRKHIIHRDIKPSNLLLNSNMDLKIADFGLSKQLHEFSDPCYTVCGTPNYISPEILSKKPYGMESDLWSLGVVLFFLLTAKFPEENQEIYKEDVNWKVQIPPHVSEEASDLIRLIMQLDPPRRLPLSGILSHPFLFYIDENHPPKLHYESPSHHHSPSPSYPLSHSSPHPPSHSHSHSHSPSSHSHSPSQHHPSPSPSHPHSHSHSPLSSHSSQQAPPKIHYDEPRHKRYTEDHSPSPSPSPLYPSLSSPSQPIHSPPHIYPSHSTHSPSQAYHPYPVSPSSPPLVENLHINNNNNNNGTNEDNIITNNKTNTDINTGNNKNNKKHSHLPSSTSTSSIPSSSSSKNISSSSNSSSVSNSIPPITTKRLKPFTLETKWGSIAISESGFVVMNMSDGRPSVCIWPDGKMLRTFGGKGPHGTYSLDPMPPKFQPYYKFAAQFIDVVKSRAPKVIYRTDMCTATLMESMKHFEAIFQDNIKVLYTKEGKQWKFSLDNANNTIHSNSSGSSGSTTNSTNGQVTNGQVTSAPKMAASSLLTVDGAKMETFVDHAKKCLRAIESKGNGENFPLDISHKIRRSISSPKNSPSSTVSGYSTMSSQPSSASIYLSSSSSVSSGSSSSSKGQMFRTAFLPGVGWGLRPASTNEPTDMWIQFHDGTQMVIAADCASVTFTDSSGLSSSHSIGLEMPPLVREKFTHASAFFDLMKSQQRIPSSSS